MIGKAYAQHSGGSGVLQVLVRGVEGAVKLGRGGKGDVRFERRGRRRLNVWRAARGAVDDATQLSQIGWGLRRQKQAVARDENFVAQPNGQHVDNTVGSSSTGRHSRSDAGSDGDESGSALSGSRRRRSQAAQHCCRRRPAQTPRWTAV